MASGKRASMREGPLAALFRRTDDDEETAPTSEDGRRDAPDAEPRAESPAPAAPAPRSRCRR